MKKLMLSIAVATFLMTANFANAQSPIDKVFEKYAGQDGFTTVNLSKEMFQMFQQIDAGKDSSGVELKEILDQLTGLKVLMFNFDSTNVVKAVSLYNEFAGVYPAASYKEMMSIQEGRQYLKFMTKQETNGKVVEFVMLLKDKREIGVISLTGNIDLSSISRISKMVNIHGMENMGKLKEKHK